MTCFDPMCCAGNETQATSSPVQRKSTLIYSVYSFVLSVNCISIHALREPLITTNTFHNTSLKQETHFIQVSEHS